MAKYLYLILSIFYIYNIVFYIASIFMAKRKRQICNEDKTKFAIIIPAHDEERVIGRTIDSLKSMDYDKSKYDIYVIADNCNDKTGEIAEEKGAYVLQRISNIKGKHHALKWAFSSIDLEKYDAVVILDADNTVDKYFLKYMDIEIQEGAKIIQGYVETQNPDANWITANYDFMMKYMNRINMARNRIGLSAWLAGTGYCVATDILRKVDFDIKTLVDDAEYTLKLIMAGEKVAFSENAVVYDQKPITLKDSMIQRLRWVRGQTEIIFLYLPSVAKGLVLRPKRFFQYLDCLMFIPMNIVILLTFVLAINKYSFQYVFNLLLNAPLFYLPIVLIDKIFMSPTVLYVVTTGIFYLTWIPVTLWGIITYDKKVWKRTPHY